MLGSYDSAAAKVPLTRLASNRRLPAYLCDRSHLCGDVNDMEGRLPVGGMEGRMTRRVGVRTGGKWGGIGKGDKRKNKLKWAGVLGAEVRTNKQQRR